MQLRLPQCAYADAAPPKKPLSRLKSASSLASERAQWAMAAMTWVWSCNQMLVSALLAKKACKLHLLPTFRSMNSRSSEGWFCGTDVCLTNDRPFFHNSSSIAVSSSLSSKLSSHASSTSWLFQSITACWLWVIRLYTRACLCFLSSPIQMSVLKLSWSTHLYMQHCKKEDHSQ